MIGQTVQAVQVPGMKSHLGPQSSNNTLDVVAISLEQFPNRNQPPRNPPDLIPVDSCTYCGRVFYLRESDIREEMRRGIEGLEIDVRRLRGIFVSNNNLPDCNEICFNYRTD